MLFPDRQRNGELCPFSHLAFHFDAAAVIFDDVMADAQAQPRAFVGALGGKKRLENPRLDVFGNAGTCVDYFYFHVLPIEKSPQRNRPARRRKLERVRQVIENAFLELVGPRTTGRLSGMS